MTNKPLLATWSQATEAWAVFRAQRGRIYPYETILKNIIDSDNSNMDWL